jgi:ABC-2 type transport system ATP-binding protein
MSDAALNASENGVKESSGDESNKRSGDDTAIRASGIQKSFGSDGVLDGVDLDVRENEILVVLGPNGVGKTVLLECLAGSATPTSGEVELFGHSAAVDDGESLSFLLQDTMAVETLTGEENVEFYSRMHPAFTGRWEAYLDRLELTDELGKAVNDYSAGMVRKLELALTMSVDAPLYLLDEPTAGVDLSMIQRFHDIILDCYEDGATFVITSHRPLDAELADRIAFMRDGKITAVGQPGKLMTSVPPVLRVTGSSAMAAAEGYVRAGQLFRTGAAARGFLAEGVSVDDVREAVDTDTEGLRVERDEPTYTDLFNYYVHVSE